MLARLIKTAAIFIIACLVLMVPLFFASFGLGYADGASVYLGISAFAAFALLSVVVAARRLFRKR